MDLTDLILLSIALGIDCFIVSFSQGLIFQSKRRINSAKLALTMGLFQGFMPVIGYIATDKIYNMLIPYSKYIVFTIFLILGLNFILEKQKQEEKIRCIDFKCLLGLGIATSIDALVAGSTLKLTSTPVLKACFIIGLGSLIMSLGGFWSGNIIQNLPQKKLRITGGLILIILAVKSLII